MTYREINDLAEKYASIYNSDNLTPFPYENITKTHHDLDILYLDPDDDNVSGVILYEEIEDKFSILINATKHSNRQNFTLGHELGHYFLHQDVLKQEKGFIDSDNSLDTSNILYRLDDAQQSTYETEANHFAAALLMPSQLVSEAWEVVHDIEECAKLFNVSTIAMTIRLTELGLVS
ncbi:MAG: putative Zn peptidase [Candidatus Saccharibacteria bacterium]|nr:putative Zn peptidase [Candidatus Saccharibacteria bacterium]